MYLKVYYTLPNTYLLTMTNFVNIIYNLFICLFFINVFSRSLRIEFENRLCLTSWKWTPKLYIWRIFDGTQWTCVICFIWVIYIYIIFDGFLMDKLFHIGYIYITKLGIYGFCRIFIYFNYKLFYIQFNLEYMDNKCKNNIHKMFNKLFNFFLRININNQEK